MKTAILLIGPIRTWANCKQNFNEIFGHLNPDVYVNTYYSQYEYHPAVRQDTNFYDEVYLNDNQIHKMFNEVNIKNINIDHLNVYSKKCRSKIDAKFLNSIQNLYQYFKILDTFQIIYNQEILMGCKYDCIIKTRCDIILNKFVNNLDLNKNILIDDGNLYPNDCLFMTSRDAAVNIINYIISEIKCVTDLTNLDRMPHNLFGNAILKSNLNIITHKWMDHVKRVNKDVKYDEPKFKFL
jgi:hypothetical protein